MNEKFRKLLENHGVDLAVGSIQYWQNEVEMVMAKIHDEAIAAERKACALLCEELAREVSNKNYIAVDQREFCAKQIRARDMT